MTPNFVIYLILAFVCLMSILCVLMLFRMKHLQDKLDDLEQNEGAIHALSARQDILNNSVNNLLNSIKNDISSSSMQSDQKLDIMRRGLENALTQIRRENLSQISEIRATVEEKLDKKLSDSFAQVSTSLEQVYKGIGEMQSLASGVGDLKKVLSNVKTRGVLGEIQLGAILEEMLSREQYDINVATKKGSQANVEFAIKMPGEDTAVWLPVDSKFPLDAYEKLIDAYEIGDPASVESAQKELRDRIRRFAKDIHDKYISPPDTTDFAIMFLPSEGLYAEAVRIGMVEVLQREYKVCIAGPTTMGALLNSLQMGFRTLAIQKRSSEVWNILSAVKSEFDTFASVVESTQKRILQANDELDKLVGVRTRKIQNTLKSVQQYTYNNNESEEFSEDV
ncbi:MAG: DNA recombination protein RmuC [Clostridia bacterium]|nr:DNA recombination protein RmuC [Clostridia bacterium]